MLMQILAAFGGFFIGLILCVLVIWGVGLIRRH